jgi:transposase, IS30 family
MMGQDKRSTTNRKNKYLSIKERYQIEALREKRFTGREIAEQLGRSPSTINREIIRGSIIQKDWELKERLVYRADHGQAEHDEKQRNKGRPLKIGFDHELSRHIERKISQDKYSPAAVIGEIVQNKLLFKTYLCIKTIYNYIHSGVFAGVGEAELIYGGKHKKKYRKVGKINRIRLFKSIEERPEAANQRSEYGHWEIDVVKGVKWTKPCLLTISERLTRQEIIIKMNCCKVEEVDKALTGLERKYGGLFARIFKTITADNGSEFMDWETLEESKRRPGTKRTALYYAHPYSSYERGTNENTNRIIRRFVPKGTDIGEVTVEAIKKAQNWINNYPRGIFGYKTANDMIIQNATRKMCGILGVVH